MRRAPTTTIPNTNYLLAQLVLEAVTGQSYPQALRTLVLDPVGARATEVFGTAPRRAGGCRRDHARGAGCLGPLCSAPGGGVSAMAG